MGILLLFPIAAAMAVWFKRRFEVTVVPAIGLITLLVTITGMAGVLVVGVYAAIILVLPATTILVFRRKQIRKYVLTPGFTAFCFYLIFFLVYTNQRFFDSDAAKLLYGPSVRSLFTYNSIQDHSLYYDLNNPFPLGTLWVYFCTKLAGGYVEWKCIFAFDVLIIAGILPLFCRIKSIKDENWQWLLMLLIGLLIPLLKMDDAYRSFDMIIPQATTMVYTFCIMYRMFYGSERRGDILFAGYGIFAACTLTQYGILLVLPLLVGCFAMGIKDKRRRKSLFQSVIMGGMLAFVLYLYNYACGEISWKNLLIIPSSIVVALLSGWIIKTFVSYYNSGYRKMAVAILFTAIVVVMMIVAFILRRSIYNEYVVDELIEYTNKLFLGADEGRYVIGKRVISIYDMSFLFVLLCVSGITHGKEKGRGDTEENVSLDMFHAAYVFGIFIYFLIFSIIYINVIRMPKANPVPRLAPHVAPIIVLSVSALFSQCVKVWKKGAVLIAESVFLVGCVYMNPIGEIFDKQEKVYEYPVIHDCVESGKITFTEEDRVFYMDPQWLQELPVNFGWEVYPAGAGTISGLHFNADPYRWSAGEIPFTITKEELADLIREGKYTYVYVTNTVDFHYEKYYELFIQDGINMTNNAIYHVEYDHNGRLQLRFIAREE